MNSMTIRKHAPPEAYRDSYLYPISLLEPLTPEEARDMAAGGEVFRKKHPLAKLFPDPFFSAPTQPPSRFLGDLRIVAPGDAVSQSVASKLSSTLREKFGCNVAVIADDASESALTAPGPLLLLGGANRNHRSMEIAKKYQVCAFSSANPGAGGWAITTHGELEAGVSWRTILAFDASTAEHALAAFLERGIVSMPVPRLAWLHHVSPGPELRAALPDFDTWLRQRKSNLPLLQTWLASDRSRPYREIFVELLTMDYPDSLPFSSILIDLPASCLRYYELTGDERALDVFREMLWGFWNYLQTENPRIYISDMDFRLGLVCNYWNWVLHHPSFTAEEHANFQLLFLATTRMVNDYFEIMWRHKPAPFNHQTHKARTLLCNWRFFKRWNVPDLPQWKENADFIFEQANLSAFKFREDAGGYEAYVPEHLLSWREITHQSVPVELQDSMLKFAQREWAMRDNFFYPVDYGDTEPVLSRKRPFEVSPWLTQDTPEQQEMKDLESSCNGIFPLNIPADSSRIFAGLHQDDPAKTFPVSVFAGWTRLPLDSSFAKAYSAQGPEEEFFDKLVWRSGWKPDSGYVALQGLGKGTNKPFPSHAHHETNSIIRLNLGGRIWLINNGYGKKAGNLSPSDLFTTRQVGPEDHNTLVVRSSGQPVPPPLNALLKHLHQGPIPVSVTDLAHYGGVNWRRHLVVLPSLGFIVIDDVVHETESPKASLELQWNVLGELIKSSKAPASTKTAFNWRSNLLEPQSPSGRRVPSSHGETRFSPAIIRIQQCLPSSSFSFRSGRKRNMSAL